MDGGLSGEVRGGERDGRERSEAALEDYWQRERRRQMGGRGAVQQSRDRGCQLERAALQEARLFNQSQQRNRSGARCNSNIDANTN